LALSLLTVLLSDLLPDLEEATLGLAALSLLLAEVLVAAGSLLVTEAGGLVGNFTGEANFLEQKECLAASPRIYAQLVPIVQKYSKFASADDKQVAAEAIKTLSVSRAAPDAPL